MHCSRNPTGIRALLTALLLATVSGVLAGCDGGARPDAPLELFTAGALAQPMRAAADSFATARRLPTPLLEAAGSLETVRKLTELQRIPDVVGVADAELIPELLVPRWASWHVVVAHDRMVLAYTNRSRGADRVNSANWPEIVTGADVLVGRSDPDRDPAGYRALLAMRLAGRDRADPTLPGRLLASAPATLMRPKSADLVALLQAGELDYAWSYASVAAAAGLEMVQLPAAVNLGDPELADAYAAESVLVAGRSSGDTLVVHGRPILFGLTIPTQAPHADSAASFVAWLLGEEGRRVLEGAGLEVLAQPLLTGTGVPAAVEHAVAEAAAGVVPAPTSD